MRRAGSERSARTAWVAAALLLAWVQTLGAAEVERRFFLVLDAVPYSTVAALEAKGAAPDLFAQLGSPVPLVPPSSFSIRQTGPE